MASPTILTFDAEGCAVDFDVWVDDLQLFLQCDSRDGVSLFDHTSGVSTAPASTADSTVCSQWTTRDAVARLAVRSYLPPAEHAHFGQYKTAQSLYNAVVERYSSPATTALSRLMLLYLFPAIPSPPVFKARYVARGFSQRQGVDFFHTFSPTPKMTTLRVLLHVAAHRVYELHSLDFSTAFLQGSLHEEIWLRRPPGFTGSFPACTQWSLRRPVYGMRQAPLGAAEETHVHRPGSFSASASRTPRYSPLLCLPVTHSQLHLRTSPTSGMGLVLGGRARVVLTGHADASWVDDLVTQRSSQGYTFSLGSCCVSWRSTRSSSILSSSCEAEIYAGAMAAQELHWLTYQLTDLGEAPHSPPVLYVDIKAMLALCQEHRLEHRTRHIALRYFLA
ncbi:unnamed protein product [Closterium sp. NIES-53]